jgi:hypothetical protein
MTEPVGDTGPSSFVDSLGDRGLRRAEPRTSIAIAGAGCALGVVGMLVISADTGIDESDGDFNKIPGILLTALVVVVGYALLTSTRRGAFATAGAVAAALGVPTLLFFLTFDEGALPPYSTQGILLVSTGAWLVSYVVGPGRGRPFFLGAGLVGAWLSVLELTENVFTAPFELFTDSFVVIEDDAIFDPETGEVLQQDFGGGLPDAPDPTTIGLISLVFGIAFLFAGRRLDAKGRHGSATPFAVAALPCLAVGVAALAEDLEAAGTGLLMVLIGLGLAYHGASVWRRATTWIGAAVMAAGAAVFLIDMAPEDNATIGGLLLLAGGIAMVFAGHALASLLREPDEMEVTLGQRPVVGPRVQITTPAEPLPPPAASEPPPPEPPPEPPPAPPPPPPPPG